MTRFTSQQPRTPLARRLAVRLGVIGLALVMGVSAIVVLVDYQMLKQRAAERLDQIEVSYLASVAENVWLQDRERLTQLVEGIRQLAFIQMAEVRDEHGQILAQSGAWSDPDEMARHYPLQRTYLGRPMEIGHLSVSVSLKALRQPAIDRAVGIFLANMALMAGILVVLYWQVHSLVTHPLSGMASRVRMLEPGDLGGMITADMPNDELCDLAATYAEMNSTIREGYANLREREARLRILFDNSPVSLWEEDFSRVKAFLDTLRGEIGADLASHLTRHPELAERCAAMVSVIDVNAATLVLHGAASREDLLGNLPQTFTPKSLEAFSRQLLAIWHGETLVTVEAEVRTLAGVPRTVVVHWAVPPGHTELLDRVIVALEDVTDRKSAEQALSTMVGQLTRTNRELERMTEIAAHDLQEPIRGIVSFSQLLERRLGSSLDQESRGLLDYLMAAAHRMQDQLRGLTAYSQAAPLNLPATPTDLNVALAMAVDRLKEQIQGSGAAIEAGSLPIILGNLGQMTELFSQLIENSLKFACPGLPPRIVVSGIREAGMALISVADNGIGIAPPYVEEVFQVFGRLHGPGRFPGAGIGLSICRKVVERFGGRIWIDREPREGCAVHFTLPAAV